MADSIAQQPPTSKDVLESSLELAAGIAQLDNLIERHVEEFRRVKAQRDVLLAALKAARSSLTEIVSGVERRHNEAIDLTVPWSDIDAIIANAEGR